MGSAVSRLSPELRDLLDKVFEVKQVRGGPGVATHPRGLMLRVREPSGCTAGEARLSLRVGPAYRALQASCRTMGPQRHTTHASRAQQGGTGRHSHKAKRGCCPPPLPLGVASVTPCRFSRRTSGWTWRASRRTHGSSGRCRRPTPPALPSCSATRLPLTSRPRAAPSRTPTGTKSSRCAAWAPAARVGEPGGVHFKGFHQRATRRGLVAGRQAQAGRPARTAVWRALHLIESHLWRQADGHQAKARDNTHSTSGKPLHQRARARRWARAGLKPQPVTRSGRTALWLVCPQALLDKAAAPALPTEELVRLPLCAPSPAAAAAAGGGMAALKEEE